MNPQGPQIIAVRSQERSDNLQKWRKRYERSEYPSKVAINLTLEALVKEEEHSYYENGFNSSKVGDLQEGVEKVREKEKKIRDDVIAKAQTAYESRSNIGSIELKGLRETVDAAASSENSAVEDVEFSYVYYGGVFELFTGWYAAGLCGLSREEAMVVMTGQSIKSPSDVNAVEGYFCDYAGAVLQQTDSYQELPSLW